MYCLLARLGYARVLATCKHVFEIHPSTELHQPFTGTFFAYILTLKDCKAEHY